jgi:hypothetical protein
MKKKIILTSITGTLAALGGVALYTGGNMMMVYAVISVTLLALVAIGGILQYTSQEFEDFRDIYREKDRLQKEKIRILTESLINKEKALILEQSSNSQPQQQQPKEEYTTVIVDCKL